MNANREKIVERIRLLRERTTDHGCTEAEAMVAADMLARLMSEHDVTMTDVDVGEELCQTEYVATGTRAVHEVRFCLGTIAKSYDCKAWINNRDASRGKLVLFGLPADAQAASYLINLIRRAMDQEVHAYSARCASVGEPSGRSGNHSFLVGMAVRINARLDALKVASRASVQASTGRDLVPVKMAAVVDQFRKLGFRLRSSGGGSSIRDSGAFAAGKAAGDRVSFNRAVGQSGGTLLIGR